MPGGSWTPVNINVTPKLVGGSAGQRVTVGDHASCNHPPETQATLSLTHWGWEPRPRKLQHGWALSMLASNWGSSSGGIFWGAS